MAELQLKVVKNSENNVFGKAINNFNKVLYSSGGGFYNLYMNSKRNSLIKAFANFEDIKNLQNETKQKNASEKYEKVYENYLAALEKYFPNPYIKALIVFCIYTRYILRLLLNLLHNIQIINYFLLYYLLFS